MCIILYCKMLTWNSQVSLMCGLVYIQYLLHLFQAECFKNEDCSADKFCSKLRFQCQQCVDGFGCFNDDQCCGKKVCKFGNCQVEPGKNSE